MTCMSLTRPFDSMKITIKTLPRGTFAQFCEKHGLTLKIKEINCRKYGGTPPRFMADLKPSPEIMEDGCLVSTAGHGSTPMEAVEDLMETLSGQPLAFHAYTHKRREITAWTFSETGLTKQQLK